MWWNMKFVADSVYSSSDMAFCRRQSSVFLEVPDHFLKCCYVMTLKVFSIMCTQINAITDTKIHAAQKVP